MKDDNSDFQASLEALDALAWRIEADGVDQHAAAVAAVAHTARRAGLRGVVVDLLLDGTVPAVVRERAFGIVASRLASPCCPEFKVPAAA
jgi:hypothetical protein